MRECFRGLAILFALLASGIFSGENRAAEIPRADGLMRYVAAVQGLRLRISAAPGSDAVATIAYGQPVRLLAPVAAGSTHTDGTHKVEQLDGAMVAVRFGERQGYVFSGLLVSLPMPARGGAPTNRWDFARSYVEQLRQQRHDASFTLRDNRNGGMDADVLLPLRDIQEAFLVARVLFAIPLEYQFPAAGDVTLSTPANPSASVRAGPYTHVTQAFALKRHPSGEIASLRYHDDSEAGGKDITISRHGPLWAIRYRGWAH